MTDDDQQQVPENGGDGESQDAGDGSGAGGELPEIPDDVMSQITALADEVGGDAPAEGGDPFCLDFCFYVNGRPWHSFKLCDFRGPEGVNEQAAMICQLVRSLGATCQPVPGAPCPGGV